MGFVILPVNFEFPASLFPRIEKTPVHIVGRIDCRDAAEPAEIELRQDVMNV
jgi:hypothetical protein